MERKMQRCFWRPFFIRFFDANGFCAMVDLGDPKERKSSSMSEEEEPCENILASLYQQLKTLQFPAVLEALETTPRGKHVAQATIPESSSSGRHIHLYICVCVCIYIYTYIHTYIHTQ